MTVVVGEAAAGAGVGGAVVAAEGATESIDEDGGALGGKPVVVAIGRIVATSNLGRIAMQVVDFLQKVDIRGRFSAVGVDDHQPLVAAAEEVNVDEQLHFAERYQGVVGEITAADEATLFAAEEQKNIGVVSPLKVGHTGQVHHGGGAAGVIVGAVEDGVATHTKMLIVGGEDYHGVHLTRDVATDVLRTVAGGDDGRLGACMLEAEVLKVVFAQRLHTVGHQLAAQVVGGNGVTPILHPTAEHLLAAEVADDATRIGAVLRRCESEK